METQALTILRNILHEKCDDIGCATAEEVSYVIDQVEQALYAAKVVEFKDHVEASMKQDMSDEDWDTFYGQNWVIMYNGKALALHNGATPYNTIYEMLKELIADEL